VGAISAAAQRGDLRVAFEYLTGVWA